MQRRQPRASSDFWAQASALPLTGWVTLRNITPQATLAHHEMGTLRGLPGPRAAGSIKCHTA